MLSVWCGQVHQTSCSCLSKSLNVRNEWLAFVFFQGPWSVQLQMFVWHIFVDLSKCDAGYKKLYTIDMQCFLLHMQSGHTYTVDVLTFQQKNSLFNFKGKRVSIKWSRKTISFGPKHDLHYSWTSENIWKYETFCYETFGAKHRGLSDRHKLLFLTRTFSSNKPIFNQTTVIIASCSSGQHKLVFMFAFMEAAQKQRSICISCMQCVYTSVVWKWRILLEEVWMLRRGCVCLRTCFSFPCTRPKCE